MPFLRRRGVMASESDMRRHTLLPNAVSSAAAEQPRKSGSIPDFSAESAGAADAADAAASAPASSTTATSTSTPSTPGFPIPAPPATPPNDSPRTSTTTMSTTDNSVPNRPDSPPPIPEELPKPRRFSIMRFRNASDSQLAARAKQQAQAHNVPPVPRPPPEIVTTAPAADVDAPQKKQPRVKLSSRIRHSADIPREPGRASTLRLDSDDRRKTVLLDPSSSSAQPNSFEEHQRPSTSGAPSSHGENSGMTLALPDNRMSDSSRSEKSDGSSGDLRVRSDALTNAPAPQSSTPFFRLPKRKPKQPEPLFPMSHLPQRGKPQRPMAQRMCSNSSLPASTKPDSIRLSTSSARSGAAAMQPTPAPPHPTPGGDGASTPPAQSPAAALFQKTKPSAAAALFRPNSRNSGQSSPTRTQMTSRGRSSTLSSLGRESVEEHIRLPAVRNSSTIARKSFGDLLGLSKIRQTSDQISGRHGSLTPATPVSNSSKNNSFQIARESIVLPERREDDTPAKYLARIEETASRSGIAAALSKGTDSFSQAVLRSYMRSFSFFGDPMDMAIRKLLMEAELPKETQQIDRCLQAFANRYHECNPGIYSTTDQAYFIAFSLLILHTDVFNKNNKHKMQKPDYLKNTRGEGVFDEILDIFYDNITYTPFIHVEDEFDLNGERSRSKKKSLFPNGAPDTRKASKEPVDPYALIIDGKLDILRPNLKDVMHLDNHYNYMGTAKSLNLRELQNTFFRTGVLQIVSARSRPDAFMSEKTAHNPQEAHPGIVDIKITKVGLLWRKEAKKKKTRSPWQEWGAILTGAQLYFFRNTAWVKNLMHQYDTHIKHGNDGVPIIFKPPLDQFKPDAIMSTDGAVALVDSTYKKHKNAFVYVRHGGFEEVLLADNEEEMNDWLAKLNYAAAFRTSGVRMRGVVGGGYDGQNRRALRRLGSDGDQPITTPSGDVTVTRSQIDHKMAQDILDARRDIMERKVTDANEKLQQENKKLETQLRNARHLQIMAPIQPKTRDSMLLSAARMAAQLKWIWMEIWRLKCHRDILLLDLEEERQMLGLPSDEPKQTSPEKTEKPSLSRDESKSGAAVQKAPRSPGRLSLQLTSTTGDQQHDNDSTISDEFQTPPTSATNPTFLTDQKPAETGPLGLRVADARKSSVSSAVSSNRSIQMSPPRKAAGPSSAAGKETTENEHEPDAGERSLLEQAGLIDAEAVKSPERKPNVAAGESEDAQERHPSGTTEKDKSKMLRRSLQRTLRESAGHLSHHRSRKGKDVAPTASTSEETARDPEILLRGSGSFVVHGKKASVIDFGGDLQILPSDERLRQRKAQQTEPLLEDTTSPAGGESTGPSDFRTVLETTREHQRRRESQGSANTATARSFRELHKKYSTAQRATSSGGNMTLSPDEDSDAALSFSEGRRTPLPPIETESVDELVEMRDGEGEKKDDDDESDHDEGDQQRSPDFRRSQFFTPEPPVSPGKEEDTENGENGDGPTKNEREKEGMEGRDNGADGRSRTKDENEKGLRSPALQAVGA